MTDHTRIPFGEGFFDHEDAADGVGKMLAALALTFIDGKPEGLCDRSAAGVGQVLDRASQVCQGLAKRITDLEAECRDQDILCQRLRDVGAELVFRFLIGELGPDRATDLMHRFACQDDRFRGLLNIGFASGPIRGCKPLMADQAEGGRHADA